MIGKVVSHYEVLEKLGGGGMGVVYKARDTRLDRLVALKFLPHYATEGDTGKQRLVREAKAASALDHANICIVHEIDETDDGQVFIVMAHYDGETLKKKIPQGGLDVKLALDTAAPLAALVPAGSRVSAEPRTSVTPLRPIGAALEAVCRERVRWRTRAKSSAQHAPGPYAESVAPASISRLRSVSKMSVQPSGSCGTNRSDGVGRHRTLACVGWETQPS